MIAKIFPTSMQWCTSSIHNRADGQVYHLQKSKDHCQGQTAQVAAEEPTTQQVWSIPPAYKGWAGDYLQTENRPQSFKPSPLPQVPDWRVSMPDSQPDNRTPAAWLSFAWSSQAPDLNKGDTSGAEASYQPVSLEDLRHMVSFVGEAGMSIWSEQQQIQIVIKSIKRK